MSESLRDRVARVLCDEMDDDGPKEPVCGACYGQADALIAAGLAVEPRATVNIARIKSAWNGAGVVPSHHERMKRIIEHQWPVLAHAIKRAIQ